MDAIDEAQLIVRQVGFDVPAGQKLEVMRGDTVRVNVEFDYRGPAATYTMRCSIGQTSWLGFDEIAYGLASIPLEASSDFVGYQAYADIDTSPVAGQPDYDMEAKIAEYPETLVRLDNVIDILEGAELRDFRIAGYEKV